MRQSKVVSEEAVLLGRIRGGDREAFRSLVERLAPQALALAVRVTANRDLAEEAMQEAFTDVWLKAGRFDASRGGVRQWIFTLVHHKAVDAVRRERSASRTEKQGWEPGAADDPEEMGVMADRRAMVAKALAQLSPSQREAISLAYFGGLTYREVAEALKIPEGTAKSRMRDGLLTMRGLLDTQGIDWSTA